MTEESLIKYMASRKSWMSYETIARYFCVSQKTVQAAIKKLEKENRAQFKYGEKGKKFWQLIEKPAPAQPDPVALPTVRVHRIQDGEDRAATKPRTKTAPVKKQSWFSALDN